MGYVIAIVMGKVDLSVIFADGLLSLPKIIPYVPEFNLSAIFSVCIIYLVSAAETIGDTSAMVASGLNREITDREISGSLACVGYKTVPVIIPDNDTLKKFNDFCRPLFEQQKNLEKEKYHLELMRGDVLPKFISGEYDVDNFII